ncbi:MAG: hypothetical protein CVU89_06285 [Firmicutes bacterium HGW-Firmicutes-14]|nr:MAG: hypothetical protein CVU89_06285 [Firmicutes bacterium HGW-Firmicutes-14]
MCKNYYAGFILKHTPKVITQIDRDEDSLTFGSCDRNYWHLKTRDFSSAILQQTSLTLALLYKLDFAGNIYFANEAVKEWAIGALEFWKGIQLTDGAFNEYYPNEHGFPPTAFTLFSSVETFKELGLNDIQLLKAMAKTANFLISNIEPFAYNQEIASIAALYSYYTICGEEKLLAGIERKLTRVLTDQTEEGWFPEYGGADFGYLSVSMDMLGEYYRLSKDQRVLPALEKAVCFIKYFCHPDGTIGGEYGSRNTMYFLPYGIEFLCSLGNSDALAVREQVFANSHRNDYFQDSVDDRYFTHYFLHSFLRALRLNIQTKDRLKSTGSCHLPCFTKHKRMFPEAGLLTVSNEKYYCVIGAKKGGSIKVFNNRKEVFADFGFRIPVNKREIAVTNWLDQATSVEIYENQIEIKGQFTVIKQQVSSPLKHLILRMIALILGKSIIHNLKKRLIFINKRIPVNYTRSIYFGEDNVVLKDQITSENSINTLKPANSLSMRHVASGKFFKKTELIQKETLCLNNIKRIFVKQVFNLDTGQYDVFTEVEK